MVCNHIIVISHIPLVEYNVVICLVDNILQLLIRRNFRGGGCEKISEKAARESRLGTTAAGREKVNLIEYDDKERSSSEVKRETRGKESSSPRRKPRSASRG